MYPFSVSPSPGGGMITIRDVSAVPVCCSADVYVLTFEGMEVLACGRRLIDPSFGRYRRERMRGVSKCKKIRGRDCNPLPWIASELYRPLPVMILCLHHFRCVPNGRYLRIIRNFCHHTWAILMEALEFSRSGNSGMFCHMPPRKFRIVANIFAIITRLTNSFKIIHSVLVLPWISQAGTLKSHTRSKSVQKCKRTVVNSNRSPPADFLPPDAPPATRLPSSTLIRAYDLTE